MKRKGDDSDSNTKTSPRKKQSRRKGDDSNSNTKASPKKKPSKRKGDDSNSNTKISPRKKQSKRKGAASNPETKTMDGDDDEPENLTTDQVNVSLLDRETLCKDPFPFMLAFETGDNHLLKLAEGFLELPSCTNGFGMVQTGVESCYKFKDLKTIHHGYVSNQEAKNLRDIAFDNKISDQMLHALPPRSHNDPPRNENWKESANYKAIR